MFNNSKLSVSGKFPFPKKPEAKPNGFHLSSEPVAPKKVIRKKSAVSFERRFLSEKYTGEGGLLEVAMMWRGDVMSHRAFKTTNRTKRVLIGSQTQGKDKVCFGIDDPRVGASKPLVVCENGRWYLEFEPCYEGFLVTDPAKFGSEKVLFSDCKPNDALDIRVISSNGVIRSSGLRVPIDGSTRAAIRFGAVSFLVRLSKPGSVVLPAIWRPQVGFASSAAASILIHAALFSIILFATDRADALNVDRILTSSRFAEALVQAPDIVDDVDVDKTDEIDPIEDFASDDEKPANDTVMPTIRSSDANASNSVAGPLTHSQAVAAARTSGLLAQATAMNSMLGMTSNLDNMNLDWDAFDANIAAQSATGQYAKMIGPGDGAFSAFTSNSFGPPGRNIVGVAAADRSRKGILPEKIEHGPSMDSGKPKVSGSIDERTIQKIVRQHTNELRACYERELLKISNLSGKITMNWYIAADGSVMNAFVKESTMHNKAVENCMAEHIKHWRFPSPRGGGMCSIVYPFTFSAGAGK